MAYNIKLHGHPPTRRQGKPPLSPCFFTFLCAIFTLLCTSETYVRRKQTKVTSCFDQYMSHTWSTGLSRNVVVSIERSRHGVTEPSVHCVRIRHNYHTKYLDMRRAVYDSILCIVAMHKVSSYTGILRHHPLWNRLHSTAIHEAFRQNKQIQFCRSLWKTNALRLKIYLSSWTEPQFRTALEHDACVTIVKLKK